jgi:hypothetical protein
VQTTTHDPFHSPLPHPFPCPTSDSFLISFESLIDDGSHAVLIRDSFADELALRCCCLPSPETVELAMKKDGQKNELCLTEWVKLTL